MSNAMMYWLRLGATEFCGIDSTTRDVCELAIAGNEDALHELHPSTLDEALHALDVCKRFSCELHRDERDARVLLDRVYFSELERETDNTAWLGEPICAECSGGCPACLGLPTQQAL